MFAINPARWCAPYCHAFKELIPMKQPQREAATASALYRAVWRWHFYAGLICLPFLAMMAMTGGLYLFNTEIENQVYHPLLFVNPAQTNPLQPQQIADIAAGPEHYRVDYYQPAAGPDRSVEVGVDNPGRAVFIDPYTGARLGELAQGERLMDVVKHIHSLAIVGTWANRWIEIVAGWAIVLVISGVYLWWPRGRSSGVLSVRGSPGKRIWWRDLHAVTGVIASAAILFLAVTGMPWSGYWGDRFSTLTNAWGVGLPEYLWNKVPQSKVPMASKVDVPWTLSKATLPQSPGAHAGAAAGGLNAAVAAIAGLGLAPGYRINLPVDEQGVYSATLFPQDATQERVVHLDQYTLQPLMDIRYADFGIAGKATEWGVAVHKGRQYGWLNQGVMLLGCVAIVLLAVSAVVMWWKRRPAGQLGAPLRKHEDRLARTVLVIAVVLGLVYPLLGLSMLVALGFELLLPQTWRVRWGF